MARTEATPRPVSPIAKPPARPEKARLRAERRSSSLAFSTAALKISGAVRRRVSTASSSWLRTRHWIPKRRSGLIQETGRAHRRGRSGRQKGHAQKEVSTLGTILVLDRVSQVVAK